MLLLVSAFLLTVTNAVDKCEQDEKFLDEKGYECGEWAGYDCDLAVEDWDYTQDGEDAILENCCRACAILDGDGWNPNCQDNEDFVDEKDYPCTEWHGYNCREAFEEWDYTQRAEQAILQNCCHSCGGEGTCKDDYEFEDEDGYSCHDWRGYNCEEAVESFGYTRAGQYNLLAACCHTCEGAQPDEDFAPEPADPNCLDDGDFVDEHGFSCDDWEGYDCRTAVNDWYYTIEGEKDIKEACCKTCTEGLCVDDYGFEDPDGNACEDWEDYNCRNAVERWGYTQAQETALLKACCRTCGGQPNGHPVDAPTRDYDYPAGCKDDTDFKDAQDYDCEDWEGYDCRTAVNDWYYTVQQEKDINEACCATCKEGLCVDDYAFEDAKGYLCEDWDGYDCKTAVSDWDYTKAQENAIIKACCRTCGGGEQTDEGEPDTTPLTLKEYQNLCKESDEKEECESYGCKYKVNTKGKKTCKGGKNAKKIKCKKIKDLNVCERIGCTIKKDSCKGSPDNL